MAYIQYNREVAAFKLANL